MSPEQIDLAAVVNPWQAIVVVALIFALIILPSIAAWVQGKRSAAEVHDVKTTLQENNGGGSVRDSLDRIESAQVEQSEVLTTPSRRVETLERRHRRW